MYNGKDWSVYHGKPSPSTFRCKIRQLNGSEETKDTAYFGCTLVDGKYVIPEDKRPYARAVFNKNDHRFTFEFFDGNKLTTGLFLSKENKPSKNHFDVWTCKGNYLFGIDSKTGNKLYNVSLDNDGHIILQQR